MTVKPQFKRAAAMLATGTAAICIGLAPLRAFSQKKPASDSLVNSIEMREKQGDSLLAEGNITKAKTFYFEAARAYESANMRNEAQKVYMKIDEIGAVEQKSRVKEVSKNPPLQSDNTDALEAGKKHAEFAKLIENGDKKTAAGDYKGAMEDYRKATGMADSLDEKYNKEIASAHCKLGVAFSSLMMYKEAVECFPKAMALDSAGLIDYYERIANAHLG
ncbi:MAG: hypothetical protein NT051_01285, partial [Candidatus Micrarchaeota archaeon]|nr:hypothetical protein [Candidatus Micrarchaeota archaeon]